MSKDWTQQTVGELVDLHYGDGIYGYVGSTARNYLTDKLVAEAANMLDLSVDELNLWLCSKDGRWALDEETDHAEGFVEFMYGTRGYGVERLKHEAALYWRGAVAELLAEYDAKYPDNDDWGALRTLLAQEGR